MEDIKDTTKISENNLNNNIKNNIIECIKQINIVKKLYIYLIVLCFVLVYFSLFFIHDIVDSGMSNGNHSSIVTNPDGNVLDESVDNSDKNGNGGNEQDENNSISGLDNLGDNNSGSGTGNQGGSNSGSGTGNQGGNNPGSGSGNQGGSNPGSGTGNQGGSNPGSGTGNQGGNNPGSGTGNQGGNKPGSEPSNPGGDNPVVDNKDRFKIYDDNGNDWKDVKELDIFKNSYFNDKSIIAPGVSGTYSFTVENLTDNVMTYDIDFLEENPYMVNMVYKLKINGTYVEGNDSNWVDYNQLSKTGLLINGKTRDVYTIEWKWQDADNDTEVGETSGAYYKMYIRVDATQDA